jgi:L-iditol 2-dehydrogenase
VLGFQTEGTAQEYFIFPEDWIIRLPENTPFEVGAMVEPVAVAVHVLGRGGDISGKKVLVLGAGTIGNLVAQVAKAIGADAVMSTDLSDYRLEVAKKCGVDYTVNTGKEDLAEAIKTNFGPDGADLIIECVGVQDTFTQAIENARKGSTIIVVGVFGEKATIDMGAFLHSELSLVSSLMYQRPDYEKTIDLIKDGRLKLEELISKTFPFESYLNAYEYIEEAKDKAMKVMISLD